MAIFLAALYTKIIDIVKNLSGNKKSGFFAFRNFPHLYSSVIGGGSIGSNDHRYSNYVNVKSPNRMESKFLKKKMVMFLPYY